MKLKFVYTFKSLGLLVVFMLLNSFVWGQRTVSGVVKDTKNEPLIGVTISIKGTSNGTITDFEGNYTALNVPNDAVLVFSYIGYDPQEIAVNGRSSINVTMGQATVGLNEVVVIGYGSQRKKDLTGSVSSVNAGDFVKGPITNPEQLVAGKIAGVRITSDGGAPGASSRIRVRGGSSLNASNDPLIVIDGVPVDNGAISGAANPLSMINPNDIENFTVLKDASATAIYGSRASNGVILITTKKGAVGGKTRFSFSTLNSISTPSRKVDVLSAQQFKDAVAAYGPKNGDTLLLANDNNWQDLIYRNAFSTDNNLSVTGAIGKTPYRASVGFLNQDGILNTSNLNRISLSAGITQKLLDDNLKIDLNVKTAFSKSRFANTDAIGSALNFAPTQPVNVSETTFGGYYEWLNANGNINTLAPRNPVGLIDQKINESNVNRTIGNIQLDYKMPFLPDLRANLNLGLDFSNGKGNDFTKETAGAMYNRKGQSKDYSQTKSNKLLEFYLNYVKDFGSSRLDLMGGHSYQRFNREEPAYADNNALGVQVNPKGIDFKTQVTLLSFFGRANYTILDKYVFTGTIRRDGSSRFANPWGTFPSAAFAWKISEEGFLKGKAISDLKLRVGYGITGQQEFPTTLNDYPYLPRYTQGELTAQYQFGNQFYQTFRAEGYDKNLKWEESATLNAGLDFAFDNLRLSGSIDVYQRKTKDLLSVIPVPAGTNLTNRLLTNVGNIDNSGVELSLNYGLVRNSKLNWNVGFNITFQNMKITNLTQVSDPNFRVLVGDFGGGVGNTIQAHAINYAPNTFLVYKQVYDAAGKPVEGVYADLSGDNKIDENDLYLYKAPQPKAYLGFTSQATYKNLTFGFVARGSIGNYVYNNVFSNYGSYQGLVGNEGLFFRNLHSNVLETKFQKFQYFSDYYVENGSFLKFDNIYVGYNFGNIAKNVALRGTLSVQNAFIISNYKGVDPETTEGIDNNIYPRPRMYALGLNLDF